MLQNLNARGLACALQVCCEPQGLLGSSLIDSTRTAQDAWQRAQQGRCGWLPMLLTRVPQVLGGFELGGRIGGQQGCVLQLQTLCLHAQD